MRRNPRKKEQKVLRWATIGWFLVVAVIVLVNGLMRFGRVSVEPSISMYVGYEWWSVVVFAVMNTALAVLIGKYLYGFRKEMGRAWWAVLVVILAAFVVLSVCPWGYYDEGAGTVSRIHRIVSYTMFAMAIPFVALTMRKCRGGKKVRWVGRMFVVMAVLCVVAFVSQVAQMAMSGDSGLDLVWGGGLLLVESVYIGMMFAIIISTVDDVVGSEGVEHPTSSE